MSLGTNLYTLRARAGMSQDALAEKLEVSRQSVSKWETDASVPELEKLIRLSELFGVTLDELIRGDAGERQTPPAPPLSEEPFRDARGPEPGKPPVSHGQLVTGNALLISGLALPLSLLLFWGADGLLLGVLLDLILIPCGLICRKCPKRAALWCAWVVWIWADACVTGAMGISTWSWLSILWANPEVLNWRLILSAVMPASLVGMTAWTLWSFRRVRLPRTWKNIALTASAWLARVAVGVLAGYIMESLTRIGPERFPGLVYPPLSVLRDVLTVAAIVLTVALLRKRPQET